MLGGGMPAVDGGLLRAGAQAGMDREQQLGRPAIGAMDSKGPAELLALGAQCRAVIGKQCLVVVAPGLGAAGRYTAESLRFNKLDAAGEGKSLFRRVHDLHDMAARAVGRQVTDGVTKLGDRR